jgi:hypothetical protein
MIQCAAWLCAAAAVTGTRAESFSWRFEGMNAVREKKELVTLREMTGIPEYAEFNSALAHRLAVTLAKPFSQGGGNETDIVKALEPIAADMLAYPTIYEHSDGDKAGNWTLAIQLPKERHTAWMTNWDSIAKSGHVGAAKLSRDGIWTILGTSSPAAVLEKAKTPAADILHISGDATFLGKLLPGLKPAKIDLHTTTSGNALRTTGKLEFAQDLPFKLSAWQTPTNTIRDPILAFTAIQGVAPHLAQMPIFKNHPAPNQLFLWNEDSSPFSIYAAAKVDNAPAFIKDVAVALSTKGLMGRLELNTNTHALSLFGLPVSVPFLRLAHTNDQNFVYAGAIPFSEFTGNPIPAELVQQFVTRTNLLVYDWELTGPRLTQIRPIAQFAAMGSGLRIPTYSDGASKWLIALRDKFQNAITEVALVNAREVSLTRRSDLGFSALELAALAQWIGGKETTMDALPPVAFPATGPAPSAPRKP